MGRSALFESLGGMKQKVDTTYQGRFGSFPTSQINFALSAKTAGPLFEDGRFFCNSMRTRLPLTLTPSRRFCIPVSGIILAEGFVFQDRYTCD